MKSTDSIQHVSDTAFWVAMHRITETERNDALFRDPLAQILVGERGKKIADSMASTAKYSYWTLTIRTCVIDAFIKKYTNEGYSTIINLGSGLDTRPYRLDIPSHVHWIEIDFPEIIALKNEKLKQEKPKCKLERIGADLSDPTERRRVFSDLNKRVGPAIILTEGVIPYLTEALVRDLATHLKEYSNFKLWISEYYDPKLYPRFQAKGFQKLLGDSPFRFFPADWFSFFKNCGWEKKEIRYLYDEGDRVGRPFPLPWFASLIQWVFGKKAMAKHVRLQAYVVFE
jgi:methyltransferase (TIGR00027 family)